MLWVLFRSALGTILIGWKKVPFLEPWVHNIHWRIPILTEAISETNIGSLQWISHIQWLNSQQLFYYISNEQIDKEFEPMHDKTYKMACAPSEDSDRPGHPPSLISLRWPHEKSSSPKLPIECTAQTELTRWMPRLIWVYAGRTCHFNFIIH